MSIPSIKNPNVQSTTVPIPAAQRHRVAVGRIGNPTMRSPAHVTKTNAHPHAIPANRQIAAVYGSPGLPGDPGMIAAPA
jgi:hypothetical protein